jgi:hypothetical protein
MGCVDMSAERLHQVNVCERAKNGIHNPRPQRKRFVVRRTRRERAGQARNGRAVAGRAPQRLRTPQAILQCSLVTAPRADVPGTTGGHAYDIVHGLRR